MECMKSFKKLFSAVSLTAFIFCIITPAFSIEEKSLKKQKKEEAVLKSKIDYINLEWWQNFNDPILEDYIIKSINYNHNLKIATVSTKEYYEYVKLQFANELPTISTGFAPAYVKSLNSTSSGFQFALPILANYEIDLFLKNRDKTRSAKKNYEMSLSDERASYIAVASAVGSTYLNIINLDKMIEIQEQITDERKIIFDLMQKRNRQGITSTADLIRADKSYIISLTELTELQKERDILLHSFCVLIGESPENAKNIKRASFDSINFAGIIPESINSDIIENRPDCVRALKKVEKAGIDVRIAKKEFLPSFSIGGLALFNAADLGDIFTTKNMLNAIGGLAGIDVFKGGAKFANLRLNKNIYERVLEEYLQTNLTAIQEINDSLVSIKRDKDKLDTVLKQEKFEEKDYGFYQKRYENGVVSKLDVAQSKENLLVVNKLKVKSKTDCFVDYISLYKAAGSYL